MKNKIISINFSERGEIGFMRENYLDRVYLTKTNPRRTSRLFQFLSLSKDWISQKYSGFEVFVRQ